MNADDKDMEITLPLLQSIEENSAISQRTLSKRLDLALGLTNAYLKNCLHKGLIKIEQIPANRYLYYLTPKGFAEKSRLTAQYLARSFRFYRRASDVCSDCLQQCQDRGYEKIILCGISELAEILSLRADQANPRVVGVYDPSGSQEQFLNWPVWQDTSGFPVDAACVITTLEDPRYMQQLLLPVVSAERIFVLDVLGK